MFIQILEEVTNQTSYEIENKYQRRISNISLQIQLYYAIRIWCNKLDIPNNISEYILQGYNLHEIKQITDYVWEQGTKQKRTWNIPTPFGEAPTIFQTENLFYQYINALFNRMHRRSEPMKFTVLIAFGITAVGYWLYKLNQQRQQQPTRREELQPYTSSPPSSVSPVIKVTKQFLVLVISASQADLLKLIKNKKHIDLSDGEALYEVTKYLWLGSETEFSNKTANISQYSVPQGEETEYDIYLVYIELKQSNKGLKSNVNQLDRYDAFRELVNLVVNFQVSPRLKIEAYENIEVYSR